MKIQSIFHWFLKGPWHAIFAGFILVSLVCILYWLYSLVRTPEMTPQNTQVMQEIIKLELQHNYPVATPSYLNVQGGDKLEIYVQPNEGIFLDGRYQSGAYPAYSDLVSVLINTPSGKKFRLVDKSTRLEIERGGRLWLDVHVAVGKKNDYNIYTGTNLKAKRLSDFKVGPITISFKWVANFDGAMMIAKQINPPKKILAWHDNLVPKALQVENRYPGFDLSKELKKTNVRYLTKKEIGEKTKPTFYAAEDDYRAAKKAVRERLFGTDLSRILKELNVEYLKKEEYTEFH